jgi:hypothetical protein
VIDPQGRKKVLLTSLTDRKRVKATEIVACYGRRWQIETSYREFKQSMMGMALTLRSKTVEGVRQEIWGRSLPTIWSGWKSRKPHEKPTASPPGSVSCAHFIPSNMNYAGPLSPAPKGNCQHYCSGCASASSPFSMKNDPGACATES